MYQEQQGGCVCSLLGCYADQRSLFYLAQALRDTDRVVLSILILTPEANPQILNSYSPELLQYLEHSVTVLTCKDQLVLILLVSDTTRRSCSPT